MTQKKTRVKIEINREWCKCCCLCIDACPKGVFERSEEVGAKGLAEPLVAHPENCINCSMCQLSCPDIAITITEIERDTE